MTWESVLIRALDSVQGLFFAFATEVHLFSESWSSSATNRQALGAPRHGCQFFLNLIPFGLFGEDHFGTILWINQKREAAH